MEDDMENVVMLAQASAYFAVFLFAVGFVWLVSVHKEINEKKE